MTPTHTMTLVRLLGSGLAARRTLAVAAATCTLAIATPAAAQRATPLRSPAMAMVRDARIAAVLRDISAHRIRETDSVLVGFGTRHTMSDTASTTRGIGAARRWIHARFTELSRECGGCLRVEYDSAMVPVRRAPGAPTVNVVNVLAWLPGRDTSRVVVIGGHYDSCICSIDPFDYHSDAPGADDDGSGTAAVLELARAVSHRFPGGLDATIIFAAYAGEEQGLLGSTHLAQRLHESGYHVVAGITNDIVGNVIADDGSVDSTSVRIFGADPDNGPSRELMRYAWGIGTLYLPAFRVVPVERLDRIQRGGDHIPFVLRGDPGLRVTERLENYKRQHLPTDDFAHVNFGYAGNVARLDAAIVASLALAPAPPDSVRAVRETKTSGGQRWLMSWKASPRATAYEILVRRTTSPVWEKVIPVGHVTSFLLPDQLDDTWAAVRAVGAAGSRSLAVSVPPPAPTRR